MINGNWHRRPHPRPSAAWPVIPPQVAQHLQVNERTVTQWLRRGHLRGFKIGKEWRVSARDLDNFLEQNANVPVGVEQNRAQIRA